MDKARFSKGLKVKYKMFNEPTETETKMIKGTLAPDFKHSKYKFILSIIMVGGLYIHGGNSLQDGRGGVFCV